MAANYPTANPSFTTKQDGVDYPQATHVNAIQDEVVAIGSALRGTLQHGLTVATGGVSVTAGGLTVSSGGATISTGSVNIGGPSSLATLQVNGTSTLVGNVSITGTLTVGGQSFVRPAVVLTHDSTRALSSAAWVGLDWGTETSDPSGMHSTASNSSRITFAASTGVYDVSASLTLSSIASGLFFGRIMLNDATAETYETRQGYSNAAAGLSLRATVVASALTDYVTVQVQSLNSTAFVYANSTGTPVRFSARLVT